MIFSFPDFVEDYLNHLASKGRKDSTIKRYMYDIHDFQAWLKQQKIDSWQVSEEDLERFFSHLSNERNYHIRTTRRIHSVLKQLARFQKSYGKSELRTILTLEPPILKPRPLLSSEWITLAEEQKLLMTMNSLKGFSDQQIETFPFYRERNQLIVRLCLSYGLTLQEVQQLSMNQVKFEHNQLVLLDTIEQVRIIHLTEDDKDLAYTYYQRIPAPVRPRYHSSEPFLIAFDFQRKTFHWSYEDDAPKRMSIIAIQKMIRLEVKRAELRKGISAQNFRNTFVLRRLLAGDSIDDLIVQIGYTSPLSIKRYLQTIEFLTKQEKEQLHPTKKTL
ncbi:tyrosine-type recombinase/integrase [Bacillus suaedae]|uniref:Phage integrase N-terminal SAM-like domain-containing protein n=1 Tax=Halalkalibacter suaedae TaxID=2822140 RepID=A0A940WZX3_9BACI|nr:site-specific integrase [Bacillus suaedae]MBP3951951.1 phage integrase N-terminal SAM-like domain-containing protein [Bacillus suaedae]